MKKLSKFLEDMITTDNFKADNFVGTIRKIRRKKGGKMQYEYAGGSPELMPMKNPDGTDVRKGLLGLQSRPTEQQMMKMQFIRKRKDKKNG